METRIPNTGVCQCLSTDCGHPKRESVLITYAEIDDGKIVIKPPRTTYEEVRQIPGSNYLSKEDTFTLPLTWSSCIILRAIFGRDLDVGIGLATWAKSERAFRIDPAMALRDKPDHDFPDFDESVNLYPYQKPAAKFLTISQHALLGDDMRIGKTPTAIRALRHLDSEGINVFPVLVIAPSNVKRVWKSKLEEWWPGVNIQVPKSGIAAAEKAVNTISDDPRQVIVLHYEILALLSRLEGYGAEALKPCKSCNESSTLQESKCQVHKKALNHHTWTTIIADEVHRISEPTALMTRAAKYISRDSTYRWGLTGTPPEDPDRFWCVMNFISPDEYPAKTKFRDRYVITRINPWSGFPESVGWKQEKREELDKFFLPRFMRRPKSVVHDVKEPVYMMLEPEMTPKQAKAYKELKATLMAEIEGGIFWVDSPGTKITRLRQLASAYAELTEDGGLILSEPSSKLDALIELLKDLPSDEQVVIFAEQKQLIELAYTRLEKNAVKLVGGMSDGARDTSLRMFEEGEARYILCTTAAGGEGISLASADTLVFLQRPYSRKDSKQAEDRIYVEGRASLIIDMQTPDTVDERVFSTLKNKDASFEQLVRDEETVKRWLA